jgi:hypothetical protein
MRLCPVRRATTPAASSEKESNLIMLGVALFVHVIHHLNAVVQELGGWFIPAFGACSGLCATCACATGHCLSAGGAAAGAAPAAAGAGGAASDDGGGKSKPRKVLPLPLGGWLGSDGRVHYGADASAGVSVSTPDGTIPIASGKVSAGADFGAAPGSDPHGNIVDLNWNVDMSGNVGPLQGSYSKSGNVGVSISPQVQQNVSSPMGGVGTQSGAWLNQYMNSREP